jgi:scyllo-inositol 2-dehydrogenase (NADP+)
MKVCNWGIIGLGHIALQFASAFQHVANASLLSVASRDKHQLALFKEKFDVSQAHCYTNYEDLINCEAVDIIYIALPHSLHFEWIMTCIERHKNVLVEKPATISSEQMNVVNDLLERKKRFLCRRVYVPIPSSNQSHHRYDQVQ